MVAEPAPDEALDSHGAVAEQLPRAPDRERQAPAPALEPVLRRAKAGGGFPGDEESIFGAGGRSPRSPARPNIGARAPRGDVRAVPESRCWRPTGQVVATMVGGRLVEGG